MLFRTTPQCFPYRKTLQKNCISIFNLPLNKSLPIEVEDGIRWVFTSVQGSFCVLHYRVSYEDEEDFEGLISEVRENIKANIKSADKDMVEFLQALYRNGFGVKVQFRLRNTDRTIVIAIDARELKSMIER